ncbi:type II toxin-antitoxin system VapC family toxin [Paenibacillus roseipurpureus]|uniref:PIN domain-containing protein n=1 Tax=Paenibacillus roseopurpureus TaxID=2918901 RepID=A0AA96LQD1_9BACL|nr:PIN domain-containing protein [Paenibacillus sp. MBLB1832]WNR45361.1 PIN domain-containing protein [Paenibacillus sp. MBLB1832]
MPLSNIDFGNSVVPLSTSGNDAFFLDTNLWVAYLYDKHEKHLACFCLISYLIKNNVILCYSEVVLVELLNSLARVLYIDDEYLAFETANGIQSHHVKRTKMNSFKNTWSSRVLKTEPETLKNYSSLALSKIKPAINNAMLIESTETVIDEILTIPCVVPLGSADFMISTIAINFGCQYILSIDGDMGIVDDIAVITTAIRNDSFDVQDMLTKLDLIDYLYSELGEADFKAKFPHIAVPTP